MAARTSRDVAEVGLLNLTMIEPLELLDKSGWERKLVKSQREQPDPYRAGEKQVWFAGRTLSVWYLRVLMAAADLFTLGVAEIPHLKPGKFYKVFFAEDGKPCLPPPIPEAPEHGAAILLDAGLLDHTTVDIDRPLKRCRTRFRVELPGLGANVELEGDQEATHLVVDESHSDNASEVCLADLPDMSDHDEAQPTSEATHSERHSDPSSFDWQSESGQTFHFTFKNAAGTGKRSSWQ